MLSPNARARKREFSVRRPAKKKGKKGALDKYSNSGPPICVCRRGGPSLQLRGQVHWHWQDCIGRRAEAEATCLCVCRRGGPSLQLRGQAHWQDCIGRRAEAEATCLCLCRRGGPSPQLRGQAQGENSRPRLFDIILTPQVTQNPTI